MVWKKLDTPHDLLGKTLLIRESNRHNDSETYYAGVIRALGNGRYEVSTATGSTELLFLKHNLYRYDFTLID